MGIGWTFFNSVSIERLESVHHNNIKDCFYLSIYPAINNISGNPIPMLGVKYVSYEEMIEFMFPSVSTIHVSKLPMDTLVEVSDSKELPKLKRYIKSSSEYIRCWDYGATSESVENLDDFEIWNFGQLYHDLEIDGKVYPKGTKIIT